MEPDFRKVVRECSKWRVTVAFVEMTKDTHGYQVPARRKPRDFSDCPFENQLGLSVARRKIYVGDDYPRTDLTACSLIHELAHILMGVSPSDIIDEVSCGMLAFEYYTAQHLGLRKWNENMKHYRVHDGWYWGDASSRIRRKAVESGVEPAQYLGLLSKNLKPTYRRRPVSAVDGVELVRGQYFIGV